MAAIAVTELAVAAFTVEVLMALFVETGSLFPGCCITSSSAVKVRLL